MDLRFQLNDPRKLEATMTITMSVEDWIELRDQLKEAWPSSILNSKINDIVTQVNKVYWPEDG